MGRSRQGWRSGNDQRNAGVEEWRKGCRSRGVEEGLQE